MEDVEFRQSQKYLWCEVESPQCSRTSRGSREFRPPTPDLWHRPKTQSLCTSNRLPPGPSAGLLCGVDRIAAALAVYTLS